MRLSQRTWLMLLLSGMVVMAIASYSMERIAAEQGVIPSGKSTADERNTAFKWFSELGYPDVKDRIFVDVATGHWVTYGNNPTINTFARGFLLEHKGNTFKVLTLSLTELPFEKTPPGTPAWKQVSFEASNLKDGAAAYLKALRSPQKDTDRQYSRFGEPSLHTRTETFVLAWACWREGLDELAAELFDRAARTPNGYGYKSDDPPKESLQKLVAADLAHTEMWRGVLAFGDPAIPRTELREKFEHIIKCYPESKHHKAAKETIDLLAKMIKEDAAHEKIARKFDELNKKEQIAHLIFQLRDQNGHQFMQPGSCDIFDTFAGKKGTPAHKLVDLGYEAVPQLIEHLDDERYTRSVGFHRNFYFSHHVLRVSECANTVISRIAGRSFYVPPDSKITQEEVRAKEKAAIKAWYADLVKKGEKGFLIDATERGDQDSVEMGRRLTKKYPEDALPILIKGARATKIGHVRTTMVGLIASCKGDEPLQFLLSEIKDGPFAQPRLVSAEELHKLGRTEGLTAMIDWWKSRVDAAKGAKEHDENPGEWSWYITRFLVNCGEMEAMNALAKDLNKQPVNSRLGVIAALGGTDDGPFRGEKNSAKDPEKMAAAVEALLIATLDDREESLTSKDFPGTRVCDAAAQVLSRLYAKKYTFDPAAQSSSRNRQLVIMKNVWHGANKLPQLPVPELRKIPAVPADELRPTLDRYVAAVGDKRLAVRNEIEKLGLGALPGVLERRDKASEKLEQVMWNELAKRLSCIVDEIEIAEGSVKPDGKIAKRLESSKGKPFDAEEFIQTIGIILKNSPKGAQGVRVVVTRTGDGTGFSMMFDFLANPKNAKGPPSQWSFSESVKIGKAHVRGQLGATSDAGLERWTRGKYPDLEKILAQASAVDPDQPIEIRIHVAPEWRQ